MLLIFSFSNLAENGVVSNSLLDFPSNHIVFRSGQFWFFIFFPAPFSSYLTVLGYDFQWSVEKKDGDRHSCLVPNFKYTVPVMFAILNFYRVNDISFCFSLAKGFYHEWLLKLLEFFSKSVEMTI